MQWTDTAIVLSIAKHGESSLILQVLTHNNGRYAGLLRGAKKYMGICQPGNLVEVTWKARLEEHLGVFSCEPKKAFSIFILDDALKLAGLSSACALVEATLPEREPHYDSVFEALSLLLCKMEQGDDWLEFYILFEQQLLSRLGYGLDLHTCADTGAEDRLIYVSPKSGRAVSEESGEPYKGKLLKLPSFLRPQQDTTYKDKANNMTEIVDGLTLTGYFLEKSFFGLQSEKIPISRKRFEQALRKRCE